MRRATSGASIAALEAATPILSVAAHEGPYAFKFKGLTLWLAKTPRLKLLGVFRRCATRRLTCAVPEDATTTKPPAEIARNACDMRDSVAMRRDSAG